MPQFNFSSRLVWRNLILLRVVIVTHQLPNTRYDDSWFLGVLTLNKTTAYLLHAFSYAERVLLTHFRPKIFGVISIVYLEVDCVKKKPLKIRNTTINSEGTWSVFRYDWLESLCNKLRQTVARAESQRIVVHESHREAKLINTSPYMLTVFTSNTFCWSLSRSELIQFTLLPPI
jgi:hypothetical protein